MNVLSTKAALIGLPPLANPTRLAVQPDGRGFLFRSVILLVDGCSGAGLIICAARSGGNRPGPLATDRPAKDRR